MDNENNEFPKYEPPRRTIIASDAESVLKDWKNYLNLVNKYDISQYALDTNNEIINLIMELLAYYSQSHIKFSDEYVRTIDKYLKEIYPTYIQQDNGKLNDILSAILKALYSLSNKYKQENQQKDILNLKNFSENIVTLSEIDINDLTYKAQQVYNKTNYNIIVNIVQLFQLESFSNNLHKSFLENSIIRNNCILLNECFDKLLSIDDINLIKKGYLEAELQFLFHEIDFNLRLYTLTKNINPQNINDIIELANNLDQAQKKFNKLDDQITQDYKNISKNILPQFQTSYDQYTEMLSSLEGRIQSLQAECSNLELAHYFKKEADKLKVDTDTITNEDNILVEYISHPYSRWLGFTIIGMISIFYLTYRLTFSLEANITSYQDLIKYSPMYMVLCWFTWFSSKQFSYIKQLHDEYRYKYVLSKSYFAYRKEAENLVTDNKEALLLLLKCVIANISTSPVQSVRPDVHTPFSEILNTVSKVPLKSTDDKK